MSQPTDFIAQCRQEFDNFIRLKLWLQPAHNRGMNLHTQGECEYCGKKTKDTIIETRQDRLFTLSERCFDCYFQEELKNLS